MESTASNPLALSLFAGLIGLIVGSFLNVLALRSLSGDSVVWPPSRCPKCEKAIAVWDNIPVLSYLLLKGRCRHCSQPISLQYPAVELATALSFVVLVKTFGPTWQAFGMAVFVATLIAVTVTDIHEKLIPHDITYPSMIFGIGFSSFVRKDVLGAMAGIGASYILFDFLAHYGLKLYNRYHPEADEEDGVGDGADEGLDAELQIPTEGHDGLREEIEVMGGGDAVLSAVIASYLGWQRLLVALLVSFVVGTVMGIFLLIVEMKKADLLKEVWRPALSGVIVGFSLLGLTTFFLSLMTGMAGTGLPWLQFGLLGAAGGGLLGIVSVGTRVSKPFPFGPALAIGGIAAIFWDPIGSLFGGGA
jgi:prepilin signal peptidase PulO-like enzyme (type II secretory pathway)